MRKSGTVDELQLLRISYKVVYCSNINYYASLKLSSTPHPPHVIKYPSFRLLIKGIHRNIIIIIGIQPLGRSGQRPEFSQATGMALVRCILGKFLRVVCHCFPPPLDVPTFATRCLNDARDPSGGRWNCGRECCPVILPK